jgi:hypothetical protein
MTQNNRDIHQKQNNNRQGDQADIRTQIREEGNDSQRKQQVTPPPLLRTKTASKLGRTQS